MSDIDHVEEIAKNLIAKNFVKSLELSTMWFRSLRLEDKEEETYYEAQEAYLLCKVFHSKLEQMKRIPQGRYRARYYLSILKKLHDLREKEGFARKGNTLVWRSFYQVLHRLSAQEFALSFSGQEFHNLDPDEMILLTKSLIIIQNWSSAYEVLSFYLKVQNTHALSFLLLSYVCNAMGESEKASFYLRNALLFQPTVLEGHWDFFWIKKEKYEHVLHTTFHLSTHSLWSYRTFALQLEIYVFTRFGGSIESSQLEHIVSAFQQQHEMFIGGLSSRDNNEEIKPRVLHLLCWLIQYYDYSNQRSEVERYKALLSKIDLEILKELEQKKVRHYHEKN